ncbi:MAG: hypothetical protein ACK5LJ_12090 [Paracoccus sp. (in: a-proteobacteria)]
MNPNQFVNGFGRHLMRAVMRAAMAVGITKGIGMMANKGKNPEDMTPEERRRAKQGERNARQMTQRAKKAMRITRRMR